MEPFRVTVDVRAEAASLDDLRRAFNTISRPPYDGWLGADAAAFRAFFRLEARDAADAEAQAQTIASDALASSRRPLEWDLRAVHAGPL